MFLNIEYKFFFQRKYIQNPVGDMNVHIVKLHYITITVGKKQRLTNYYIKINLFFTKKL